MLILRKHYGMTRRENDFRCQTGLGKPLSKPFCACSHITSVTGASTDAWKSEEFGKIGNGGIVPRMDLIQNLREG
jgi:hypothetical protein